jgi:hypothetical protein
MRSFHFSDRCHLYDPSNARQPCAYYALAREILRETHDDTKVRALARVILNCCSEESRRTLGRPAQARSPDCHRASLSAMNGGALATVFLHGVIQISRAGHRLPRLSTNPYETLNPDLRPDFCG